MCGGERGRAEYWRVSIVWVFQLSHAHPLTTATPSHHCHTPLQANQVLREQLGSTEHLAMSRQAVSKIVAKETDDPPTSPEYDSLGRPMDILRQYRGEDENLGTSPVRYYPPIKSPV